ncbi:hypothetical protein H112_05285 [Trichophyton rubrum D6]|uniref:Uncharacterized protein n=1 Tax=Trichophyton rubrum CBS 288.86 TaxID=1215330 RepID=A0A022VZC0_TRIRU|nr:hypothetical protein H100_05307 [Trichophyton rubrum MR850]EZF40817.1 hypothetical protein H102_05296 [Trichophyton rubrum CBS 100081]EZF51435.1 hypothetical protein H103_05298 [Trichophyton rubrum CBS 288.86]EZF62018.1 hypothetical protein H104_05288 [Trichophyton rubrum CBS 289.86]EZF83489.1 hypothetical protein H110_05295 [Trichophyton rubrum MR1448]EZF94059.1 hypothetical protein H113_05334 [Trichophyton rubrum MR1459]EZG15718.1 hypothetical protein H107_05427 [Trichophyton rubrum CBS 
MTMQPTKREVGYPPLVASGGSSEVAGEARRPIRGRRTPRAHERVKASVKGLNVGIRAVTLDRHGTSTSTSTGNKGQDVMCTKHSHAVCGEEQGRFVWHDW